MNTYIKRGLIWALWMYILVTFVSPFIFNGEITLRKSLINIPILFVAGLVLAYFYKRSDQKQNKN